MTSAWLDEFDKLATADEKHRARRALTAAGVAGAGALAGNLASTGLLKLLEAKGVKAPKSLRSAAQYALPILGAASLTTKYMLGREARKYVNKDD
jgi:hypothetical protein